MNPRVFRVGLFLRDVVEGVALRLGRVIGIDPHDRVVLQYGPWCRRKEEGDGPLWRAYLPTDKGIDHMTYLPAQCHRHGDVVVISEWYEGGVTWVLRADAEANGIAAQRMVERWESGQ